ncbi:MAG: DUF1173 family protein [Roseateles asaccharophilus]|uniref:DUF1173 family protein n=1 Tax=Roseateles asaccharophilus TaxID=582607 RepID=UPI00391B9FC4
MLDIDGIRLLQTSPGFAEAVERAYGRRRRPRCLCRPEGIEMYIARLADGHIVKRMPGTGDRHAPACTSFEPPAELSGVRPLLGSAIREDPETGLIQLKLGFPMSRRPGRPGPARPASATGTVSSSCNRLSLRALLHYLWDQAELTRWQPGFAGRRSWGVVRRQLMRAASRMVTCGEPLLVRLEVPEPFTVEQQDAISARRRTRWVAASCPGDGKGSMLLLVAEVKEIAPGRHGYKAVIKHLPDLAFTLDEALYNRLERRFEQELGLWGASDGSHLIVIATFGVGAEGLPRVVELSLMTVTEHWLPVETVAEKQLLDRLVRNRRSFTKLLRYGMRHEGEMPILVLTDQGETTQPVFAEEVDHPCSDPAGTARGA